MSSILCIGNFGGGNDKQYLVADLLDYLIDKFGCKFIIGLGNNILPYGVCSIKDKQFKEKFEEPYEKILGKVKFYNILGEADYSSRASLNSEIKYGKINKNWVLPHNFYCFKKFINKIPVEFIAMDSNLNKIKNQKTQEQWIINTLLESRSRWNIVLSHHPWFNYGQEPYDCGDKLDTLFNKINSTNKIDLIISGYETNQQHIYIPNKPNIIISGVGSQNNELPVVNIYKELKYESNNLGCCMIEFHKNSLNIHFYNIKKKKEYNFSIHKV